MELRFIRKTAWLLKDRKLLFQSALPPLVIPYFLIRQQSKATPVLMQKPMPKKMSTNFWY